jgi:hypothetical protein
MVTNETLIEALDRMHELVCRFGLHDSWPVDLAPLEALYPVVERDLEPAHPRAFAVPPLSEGGKVWVCIDRCLSPRRRRVLYAHEIGHALLDHLGSRRAIEAGAVWVHERQEAEAWTVAAALLIPIDAWGWGDSASEVAARCEVPEWLARKYPGDWVR